MMTDARSTPADLLIFGAGSLGARVGQNWLAAQPDSKVLAITRTDARFEELKTFGFLPVLKPSDAGPCDNVLVSLPSSVQTESILKSAAAAWTGRGRLLLISSTRIYSENQNGLVVESSPTDQDGWLAQAEQIILQKGGTVLRFVGLYDEKRGPQHSYLRKNAASGPANGYLNLIHYDDAAALAARVLASGKAKAIYMGTDGDPILRSDYAKLVLAAANATARFKDFKFGDSTELGKRCQGQWTEHELSWKPTWTFRTWVEASVKTLIKKGES